MKLFVSVPVAALLLTACTTFNHSGQTQQEMRNTAIVIEVFDAFKRKDLDTLEKYFDVDGDVIIGLKTRKRGGPYDAFIKAAAFPGSLDNVTVNVENIIAEDDKVAIQSLICGEQSKPILGYEPTSKQICSRYINFYVLKGEKIVSNTVGFYREQIVNQLKTNAEG